MIRPSLFYKELKKRKINLHVGVPDSLLANYTDYISSLSKNINRHIITANEGNAIGVAIGHYLSTKSLAVVYMQNSGIGNAINPLISLAHKEIYSIPMILMIGWRGEPDIPDEPQHIQQGLKTIKQLELLDIPFWIIDNATDFTETIDKAYKISFKNKIPVALVIKKNTFSKEKNNIFENNYKLKRERALEIIFKSIRNAFFVSTTGKLSREAYELRKKENQKKIDFLTVGGMGHASSIALGISINHKRKKIICLDGDGAMIMHMGSLPIISSEATKNFIHILFNNECHESVGRQPTVSKRIDFYKLSESVGYKQYFFIDNEEKLIKILKTSNINNGPIFLEIKVSSFSRSDLGRPKEKPKFNKEKFMKNF